MRLFWEIAKLAFRRHVTYRAATIAGLMTNFFFGLLRAMLLIALYGARPQVNGLSVQDAITFTGISQASIAFLSLFGWYDIIRTVYNGGISADLLKPMNYFTFWLAQDLGRALVQIFMRSLPIMIFYAVYFHITTPKTIDQWTAFGVVLFMSLLLSFSWRFLLNLSAFWVPNAIGIGRVGFTLSWFLSGFLMPLRFLPDWFNKICYLTPFPHMVNTPIETYLGLLDESAFNRAFLNQLMWLILLIAAGQIVYQAGVKKLVIQGG